MPIPAAVVPFNENRSCIEMIIGELKPRADYTFNENRSCIEI